MGNGPARRGTGARMTPVRCASLPPRGGGPSHMKGVAPASAWRRPPLPTLGVGGIGEAGVPALGGGPAGGGGDVGSGHGADLQGHGGGAPVAGRLVVQGARYSAASPAGGAAGEPRAVDITLDMCVKILILRDIRRVCQNGKCFSPSWSGPREAGRLHPPFPCGWFKWWVQRAHPTCFQM